MTATPERELQIYYSRGRDKFDAYPEQRTAVSFSAFRDSVLGDRARAKGLTWISAPFAQNGDGRHHRCREGALPRAFLAFDLDGGTEEGFVGLSTLLWSYSGFGYTTASHSAERPHARYILELSRPVDRAEGIRLGAAMQWQIEARLGPGALKFDDSVYRGEQPVYGPLLGAEVMRYDGDPIDVNAVLASAPEEPSRERPTTPDPYRALIIERGLFLRELGAGKDAITCPFEKEHSEKTSDSSTIYFRPLHNGYRWGRIHCSHRHCRDREQDDFIRAMGAEPKNVWKRQGRNRGNGKTEGPSAQPQDNQAADTTSSTKTEDKRIFHDTDFANARRLAKLHGEDLRFTPDRGWIAWIGTRWVPDDQGRVMELAKDAAKSVFDEIRDADEAAQGQLFKWARRSQSVERARAMLALTQSEPGIPAHWVDFDADPWSLNLVNGALNLEVSKQCN